MGVSSDYRDVPLLRVGARPVRVVGVVGDQAPLAHVLGRADVVVPVVVVKALGTALDRLRAFGAGPRFFALHEPRLCAATSGTRRGCGIRHYSTFMAPTAGVRSVGGRQVVARAARRAAVRLRGSPPGASAHPQEAARA